MPPTTFLTEQDIMGTLFSPDLPIQGTTLIPAVAALFSGVVPNPATGLPLGDVPPPLPLCGSDTAPGDTVDIGGS